MEKNIRFNRFFIVVLLLSCIALFTSFYFEFVRGSTPCLLCKLQRLPYVAAFLGAILGLFMKEKKIIVLFLSICFLIGASLAFYHILIQMELLTDPCKITAIKTIEEFQRILHTKAGCKDSIETIASIPISWLNVAVSSVLGFFVFVKWIGLDSKSKA